MNKFKRNYFYNITRGRRIIEKMAEFDKKLPIKNIIERNEVIYNQDKSREYEKECIKSAWGNMKGYYIAAEGIEFIYSKDKNKDYKKNRYEPYQISIIDRGIIDDKIKAIKKGDKDE